MYLLLACCKVQLVSQSDTPCSHVPLLGDNTRFSDTWHDRKAGGVGSNRGRVRSRDVSGRRFPNPSASRGRRFCSSWNRLLCSMLIMFLRARCCLVGAFAVHIQPAKQTMRITNWSWRHTFWYIRVQTGSWNVVTLSALWPTSSQGT